MWTPPDHLAPSSANSAALVSRSAIRAAVEEAQASGVGVGVIHLDMDRFHQINNRWGQQLGDQVLEATGGRLLRCLPAGSLLGATEGDAFVAMVPSVDFDTTRTLAEGLLEAVRQPMLRGDLSVAFDSLIRIDQASPADRGQIRVTLNASAGFVSHAPADPPSDLLEQAFLACRRAKATMRGSAIGYELGLGADDIRRQRTEEGLRSAIIDGQLRLHVQPTVDLRDGRMVGVEALVRWQHPTDGLLAPADFLPMAEAAGLMTEIGDWVLDEAMRLALHWRIVRQGAPLRIWVNLAAQQLADGEHLYNRVRAAMDSGLITPHDIGFEVTESSLLEDLPSAVGALSSLRALGMEIALDDFGTGYSSLTYLRQLPVSAVKIDRSFVGGIGGSLADEAIVEAVIDLAHALGLRVIAEGIEDLAQADALIRMGADEAQGYYFGCPEPFALVEPKLSIAWCGVTPPGTMSDRAPDRRADEPAGFGSARARLLLTALDTVHDSIIVTGAAAGREGASPPIVYVNQAFETETGFRSRDVIGHTIDFLLAADAEPEHIEWLHGRHTEALSITNEVASRRADGTTFLCEVTRSPILDERGIHTHWLHVRRDLTLRRSAESRGDRLQGLIEQSASLVAIAETGGQWVYANAAQRAAIGVAADEAMDGWNYLSMYTPKHRAELVDTVIPALHAHGRWSGRVEFLNVSTGAVTEAFSDIHVVDDPLRPGVKIYASVGRDMTEANAFERAEERRRELSTLAAEIAQQALARGRDELFRDLEAVLAQCGELLHGDIAYVDVIDLDAGVLRPLDEWVSPRCRERDTVPIEVSLDRVPRWVERLSRPGVIVGSEASEINTPWRAELAAVFPGQPFRANLYAALHVGGRLVGVFGLASLEPNFVWTEDEASTVQQIADTIANLIGREIADRARRAGEMHVAAMLGNVRDILVVLDRNGWILSVNDPIEAVVGVTSAEIVGNHFLTFVHPDDVELALARFAETLDGEREPPATELRLRSADGAGIWFDCDTSGVDDPVLGGYVVALRNVTAQHALREATERRSEFEQMLLALSHWALNVDHEQVGGGLTAHIQRLGEVLGADAAGVWLIDGGSVRSAGQWCDPDSKSPMSPVAAFNAPVLTDRLRTTDTAVVVNDIDAIQAPWADEWRSIAGHGRSALLVPLVSGGSCLGLTGVMMGTARVWAEDEIAHVRRVADTVSALLARERVEASLRTSEARLAALLDSSLDLVVVVTDEGDILYANRSLQRALGYSPEDMIGRSVAELIHDDDLDLAMTRLQELAAGNTSEVTTLRVIAQDQSVRWIEIISGLIRNPIAGGKVLTCRDVTERRALEVEAAARVSHLCYAFEVAQSALDLEPQEFLDQLSGVCHTVGTMLGVDLLYVDRVDEQSLLLTNLGGYVSGNNPNQRLNLSGTVPFTEVPLWIDRLRRLDPVVERDARLCAEQWAVEKRTTLGPEGGLMAVAMSAAGELFGVFGVSMVDTERMWTEDELTFLRIIAETIAHVLEKGRVDDALRRSETRFRLLSETAADVVLLVDAVGAIQYASPSSLSLLGYTPDQLIGRVAQSMVHSDDVGLLGKVSADQLEFGVALTSECRLERADGTHVWVANSISAVVDPASGMAVEYRASVRDISERKRLEAALKEQALHDPLTGLGNRIMLQSRLAAATDSDPLSSTEISVLLIDLDEFKSVNDTYGHSVGDDVLRIISARLTALTRQQDTLARTGGDEFVVICPTTSAEAAVRIGERIIEAVRQPLATNGMVLHLGASVGVAHHVGGTADPGWLLIDADHAMYAAKREGRGRVRVAATSQHTRDPTFTAV